MKINYELKIGDKSYFIEDEVESMQEFLRKHAPFQALETATLGMTGVYLSHRQTKSGDEYFALYRVEDNKELHLGVKKEGKGLLFPGRYDKANKRTDKTWKPVLHGNSEEEEQEPPVRSTPPASTKSEPITETKPGTIKPMPEQEERLTVQIRELLEAAGIENAGHEKTKVMKALELKTGALVKDLAYHQKLDLYGVLVEEAKLLGKRAA